MSADVQLIACMSQNRVIGLEGQMPWHFKTDLQHFKQLTSGHTVVMGRKTFLSIGRPLPRRRNLVLSAQDLQVPGVEIVHSWQEALAAAAGETLFVIGGGQVYRQALPLARVIHLTRIEKVFDGDTFFPEFEQLPFVLQDRIRDFDAENGFYYSFETWALTCI